MKRTDTGPFAIVPTWVLDAPMSDRAVHLYGVMRRYADKGTGECWPARREIAKRMRCSTDSVDRAMAELVALGAVSVEARTDANGQHSNRYTVLSVPPPLGTIAEGPLGTDAEQNESHLELETGTTYQTQSVSELISRHEQTINGRRSFDLIREVYLPAFDDAENAGQRVGVTVHYLERVTDTKLTPSERAMVAKTVREHGKVALVGWSRALFATEDDTSRTRMAYARGVINGVLREMEPA